MYLIRLFYSQPPGFDDVGGFGQDEYRSNDQMYNAGSQQNMSGSQHDMSRGMIYITRLIFHLFTLLNLYFHSISYLIYMAVWAHVQFKFIIFQEFS